MDTAEQAVALLERYIGCHFDDGNSVEVLRNGVEIFPSMLNDIEQAERTIDFLTFVYWDGDIAEKFCTALSQASQRGVRVRIVVDGYGGMRMENTMVDTLKKAGCDFKWFRPLSPKSPMRNNHRTHRKLLIVDHHIGFTGGVGIADEWGGDANEPGEWRDSHFRFTGPVVTSIHSGFYDNWMEAAEALPGDSFDQAGSGPATGPGAFTGVRAGVISSPSQRFTNTLHSHFLTLFNVANETIELCTAYFVPDEAMRTGLIEAAQRGVRVRVLIPGPHFDKKIVNVAARPDLEILEKNGIEVRLYQASMLHAKVLVIDGVVSSVGSANFNHRSTSSDEELNVVIVDERVSDRLRSDFEVDFSNGTDLAETHWDDPSVIQRLAERVLSPFRELM